MIELIGWEVLFFGAVCFAAGAAFSAFMIAKNDNGWRANENLQGGCE